MTKPSRSLSESWRDLDLLEDYLSGGFARPHPELAADDLLPDHARTEPPRSPSEAAGSPLEGRQTEITGVAEEIARCTLCTLSIGRTRTVPGEGAIEPIVFCIGEGPGEEEDRTGHPFVGKAGQYLDTWLGSIGLSREKCFIANCVKCRPPQNREPRPEEIAACARYLDRQIAALAPRLILCLGRIAAHRMLDTQASLSSLRGKAHSRKGIPLIVTYHPSAVLRDQTLRRPVWDDLKLLKSLM